MNLSGSNLIKESHYKSLFDHNPNPVFLCDLDGNFISINESGLKVLNCTLEDLVNQHSKILVHEKDQIRTRQNFLRATKGEMLTDQITIFFNGVETEVLCTRVPVFEENQVVAVFVIAQDVTERIQLRNTLVENEKKLRTLIEAIPDFICFKDDEGRWQTYNKVARQLFELENMDCSGKTDAELAPYSPFYFEALNACIDNDEKAWQEGTAIRVEERLPKHDGTEKFFDTIKVPTFHSDGSRNGLLVVGRDITERVLAEKRVEHMAYHDMLTGLPNRTLFVETINKALEDKAVKNGQLALMLIDLDGFKGINDTLGHSTGDLLLKQVSDRLRELFHEEATIYRVGGDEFILFLPEISHEQEAFHVARRILKAFEDPWIINKKMFHITASVGVAIAPFHGDDTETLVRNADMAMYRAKEKGKNNYRVFDTVLHERMIKQVSLEDALREGIRNHEFILHYQPIVTTEDREIVAAEALIRWNRPGKGMVSPADFIPVAETTGLIVQIGEMVLRSVFEQAKAWEDKGYKPIRFYVNLSSRQFQETSFLETTKQIIQELGVNPERIGFEITESLLMEDVEYAIKTLQDLREMGCMISIDDFGTGYSSLGYLKKFPIDKLKIDQTFVRDITTDPDDEAIVNTIIALAKNLSLTVVAEGVETEDHFLALKEKGCDKIQGYLISKPLAASDFEAFQLTGLVKA